MTASQHSHSGPERKKHCIAFVITDVAGGGAARVGAILCSEWAAAGHEVHLVTFEEAGTKPFYALDGRVKQWQIGAVRSRWGAAGFAANNLLRVVRLRHVLREVRPAAVIAFLLESNVTSVLAGRSLGIPVLISERNHPAHHRIARPKQKLRQYIYPRASGLVVQSEAIRQWFAEMLGMDASVIANPVRPVGASGNSGRAANGRRQVVGLGRLEPQKGFDRVIAAFAEVSAQFPGWDLVIHGEGEERGRLQAQIDAAGLCQRVTLAGVTSQPLKELAAADLFVHAARYEGYPNAVIEALSAGCCVVATDSPGATGEVLDGGAGLLVPDDDAPALSAALARVMADETLRDHYAARAPGAVTRLAPAAIAARWIEEVERYTS